MARKRLRTVLWLPVLLVILLDQVTKLAVIRALQPHEVVPVIPGFFNLVHVRNPGIAFGLLSQLGASWSSLLLSALTTAAIILLVVWWGRLKEKDPRTAFGLSLVVAGAVGNLVDRIRFGEVVDFLDFFIASYHWPAFNVADSAVTVGTAWVAWNILFEGPARK